MEQKLCNSCHFPILETYYFCPNCGKKIKEPPLSTSLGKQIGVYLLSILLPPFGLFHAIKYLSQPNPKAKIIGMVATILTIGSIIASILVTIDIINQLNRVINTQLNSAIMK